MNKAGNRGRRTKMKSPEISLKSFEFHSDQESKLTFKHLAQNQVLELNEKKRLFPPNSMALT